MYQPSHFEQTDPAALQRLMADHPFASLIHTAPDGRADADHLPLQWRAGAEGSAGVLSGHVARANPLWQTAAGHEVLVVFQGPQAYISPSWYPSKQGLGGKVVPTWNYTVVHAHGVLRTIDSADDLLALLHELTDHHEGGRSHPWSVADAPADYIAGLLRAIVGIRIELSRIEGKWKLSQNRPQADRTGVADALAGEADASARDLAGWIADAGAPLRT